MISGSVPVYFSTLTSPVYMDATSNNWPEIAISAGQRGMQIIAAPQDLQKATNATVAELIFA